MSATRNKSNFELLSFHADLSDIDQVKKFADEILDIFNESNPLDVFINNAGIVDKYGPNRAKDKRFELTFMVNVVAPFILLSKLMSALDALIPKRILVTSSGVHKQFKKKLDYGDL